MKESVIYQAIVEEGLEEGLTRGLVKGRVEGRVEEARELLIKIGAKRFGPLPHALEVMIESISDRTLLETLAIRTLDASSWQDLLLAK
jgi:predicted transposase YdaD